MHSRSAVATKNLFSGTLLTKIVVGVTGTREAAASGDGAKGSFTTGARRSGSELLLVETTGEAAVAVLLVVGSRTGIIQTRAALSLRFPTVYERP